jgi:hypothetical protein
MFNILAKSHIAWQRNLAPIIQTGLRSIGIRANINGSGRIPIILGPNMWREYEQEDYLFVNRYFVGTKEGAVNETVAISWNGFNGFGEFCVDNLDYQRLWSFIGQEDIKSWKDGTDYLLFDQVDNGRSKESLASWKDSIKVRYKTRRHISQNPPPLEKDLTNVRAALTFNTTAGIECLMHGIPVVAADLGNPLYSAVGHDIDDIIYPNRLPILHYLANCQWTYNEIQFGKWYERLETRRGPKLNAVNSAEICRRDSYSTGYWPEP